MFFVISTGSFPARLKIIYINTIPFSLPIPEVIYIRALVLFSPDWRQVVIRMINDCIDKHVGHIYFVSKYICIFTSNFLHEDDWYLAFRWTDCPLCYYHNSGHNGLSYHERKRSSHWCDKQRDNIKVNKVYENNADFATNHWKHSMCTLLDHWFASLL